MRAATPIFLVVSLQLASLGSGLRAPHVRGRVALRRAPRVFSSFDRVGDVSGAEAQPSPGEDGAPGAPAPSTPAAEVGAGKGGFGAAVRLLWDFGRPHTLIGSLLAVPSLFLFAAPAAIAAQPGAALGAVAITSVAAALINVYVTGLNQVTDVEIDRLNKPHLVIPAGRMSRARATQVVGACLALGLLLPRLAAGALQWPALASPALYTVLVGSAALGTVYSAKPFRLKRFPLLAALCILSVRGGLINLAFHAHACAVLGLGDGSAMAVLSPFAYGAANPAAGLATLFYATFGVAIALMKDVPDVSGDRANNINSFSVRRGEQFMLRLSCNLAVAMLYAVAAGVGASAAYCASGDALGAARKAVVAAAAAAGGTSLLRRVRAVVATEPGQVYKFYMRLWQIFYGSYLLLPFAR